MDAARFDRITRSLAGSASRRGFVAGGAALITGLIGASSAAAACPSGQVERRRVGCVSQTTSRPPVAGRCPCRRGLTDCAGACVDLDRDAANCGACNVDCAPAVPGGDLYGVCRVRGRRGVRLFRLDPLRLRLPRGLRRRVTTFPSVDTDRPTGPGRQRVPRGDGYSFAETGGRIAA